MGIALTLLMAMSLAWCAAVLRFGPQPSYDGHPVA